MTDPGRWARLNEALDDAQKPLREDFEWLIGEYEQLRVERDKARDELAEKWELYQACTGRDFYAEITPRINKLYMQLNARARGDENDFDGDPVKPWNSLIELTTVAVARLLAAQQWAVNEHQRCVRVDAENERLRTELANRPDSDPHTETLCEIETQSAYPNGELAPGLSYVQTGLLTTPPGTRVRVVRDKDQP